MGETRESKVGPIVQKRSRKEVQSYWDGFKAGLKCYEECVLNGGDVDQFLKRAEILNGRVGDSVKISES